jgi:hypothetical protein
VLLLVARPLLCQATPCFCSARRWPVLVLLLTYALGGPVLFSSRGRRIVRSLPSKTRPAAAASLLCALRFHACYFFDSRVAICNSSRRVSALGLWPLARAWQRATTPAPASRPRVSRSPAAPRRRTRIRSWRIRPRQAGGQGLRRGELGRRRAAREALDGDPGSTVASIVAVRAERHRLASSCRHTRRGRTRCTHVLSGERVSGLAPANS